FERPHRGWAVPQQEMRLELLDSCLHHRLLSEEGFPRSCQNPNSVSNVSAPTAAASSTISTTTRLFVRNARVCSSRQHPPRCRRVGGRTDGPRPSRRRLEVTEDATSVETLDGAAVLVDEDDADEDVGSIVDESEKEEQA